MTKRRYLTHKELFDLRAELFMLVEEIPDYGWCWREDDATRDRDEVLEGLRETFNITDHHIKAVLEAGFYPWRGARPKEVVEKITSEALHRAILLVSAETGRNIAKLQQQIDTLRKDIDALTG